MSDLARMLPLSLRGRRDESRVTRDRTELSRAALRVLAAMLRDAGGSTAWTADDAGTPVAQLASALLGPAATSATDAADTADARADAADPSLRTIATLTDIVVTTLRVARATGTDAATRGEADTDALPGLGPVATGAVALHLATSARYPVKAVARTQTLATVDADWQVGRGPTAWGTASEIVLFLAGVGSVPNRPAPEPDPENDDTSR